MRCSRAADADDIAQEAVLRAWRHRSSCRTPQHPWPWLRMIVQREAARAHAQQPSGIEPGDEPGCDDEGLETVIEREALRPALGGLHDTDRAVIVLHHYLDMPVVEMARTLGMPSGTVKVKLARTRAKLRDSLV